MSQRKAKLYLTVCAILNRLSEYNSHDNITHYVGHWKHCPCIPACSYFVNPTVVHTGGFCCILNSLWLRFCCIKISSAILILILYGCIKLCLCPINWSGMDLQHMSNFIFGTSWYCGHFPLHLLISKILKLKKDICL